MALGELLTGSLLICGCLFAIVSALGLVRMPDVLIRMHASTKAGTLGAGLILAAVAVHFGDGPTVSRAFGTIGFLLLTAPVAAHMIGRAAYRTGVPLWRGMVIDEWGGRGVTGDGSGRDRTEDAATDLKPSGDTQQTTPRG